MSELLETTRQLRRLSTHDQASVAAFVDFLRVGVPAPPTDNAEYIVWAKENAEKFPELKRRLAICNAVAGFEDAESES